MKVHSVKFKISVLYTLVLGVILSLYSVLLYLNLSYVIYHETDRNLRQKASELAGVISTYSEMLEADKETIPVSLKRAIDFDQVEKSEVFQWPSVKKVDQQWKYKIQALRISQDFIAIYYPSGEILQASGNMDKEVLAALQADVKLVPADKVLIKNLSANGIHLRVVSFPLYRWNKIKYIAQLATTLDPQLFVLRSKLKVILITVPLFMILTSFVGSFFVVKTFEPIGRIVETARTISYKDMAKRVELPHADDELKPLVEGFNDMISRLERSFKYIEEFSSNAAHELKTPLAIIRGELEVALRKDRPAQDYKKAIGVALDECQRMLKTINDLLLLTKLDYHTEVFKFESVDLVEFIREIYEQSRSIASEKQIDVSLNASQEPLLIQADKLHLRRLFFNLIDNAVKFTPRGGKIDLRIEKRGQWVSVSIADTGVGIAQEDLHRIFDRFFHIDRTQEAPSVNGLGLSLVQSISKIHHGGVEVRSELEKGSVFTVKLPLA